MKGIGAHIIDDKGKKWLDFTCGLGTNLFGHGNTAIVAAVDKAIRGGVTFGINSGLSVELAEVIKGKFPFIDKVRFLKSGSDGCSAAVRIARAFTGRDEIISEGYHGTHDTFVALTPPAKGVPHCLKDCIHKMGGRLIDETVAAVILEPVITDYSPARKAWLQQVRDRCTETGTILIFDETITAYRFPGLCVAKYFGIEPDLIVMGKAIAGGLPLSIVGGKREIMETDYFISTTWGDDNVAVSAALAAAKLVSSDYKPQHLWDRGASFLEKFNAISPNIKIEGYPTRGVLNASPHIKALFMQEACRAGMIWGPSWFYNLALDRERGNVLDLCTLIMRRIDANQVVLEGEMPSSPFAEKVRKL